jgi:hypothetical protein
LKLITNGKEALMNDLATAESCGEVMSGWWHSQAAKKVLLNGGIAAAGLYALGNLTSGLLYDGYSFRDQAISELSAFGSPVRPLMVTVILITNLLVVGLAVGVWLSADRKSLRGSAALLLAAGLAGLPNHTVWAMNSRWMDGGFNDTMHQITSSVWVLLVFGAMVLAAIAYRGWFRLYSILTIVAFMGFGAASGFAIMGIEENNTLWAGGFELISAYTYWAWIVVLALTVIRRSLNRPDEVDRALSTPGAREPAVTAAS